jgi:glycosyltransferase involved in cell wall biosynthesis
MGSRCGPLPRSLRQVIHPVCRTADFIKRKAKSKSIRAKRHIRNPLDTLCLGVYSDLSYRQDNEGISSTTPSFTAWLGALSSEVDELVVFGRIKPGRAAYPLVGAGRIRFVALPYYDSLHSVSRVVMAIPRSMAKWQAELRRCDAVLLFGPHPLSALFGFQARLVRCPIFVGVRENLIAYLSHRVPDRRARSAAHVARALEAVHLYLGRTGGAIVVGDEMATRYSAVLHDSVLETGISLVQPADFRPREELDRQEWPGSKQIAVVERIDPDKNPLILLEVAERLKGDGWRIVVAGSGSLTDQLASEIRARSLDGTLVLLGRLDRERLWELYAQSALLLHVSLTEGQPQVLYEAAAVGLPVVATAVGGVAAALGNGTRGMLVPPRNVDAIVEAIRSLDGDARRRKAMVSEAWGWAATDTMDVQIPRVVKFIKDRLRLVVDC